MIRTITILIFIISSFTLAQDKLQFNNLFYGIDFAKTDNIGNNVFIGYGGWSAKQAVVNNWCEQLFIEKLKDLSVKYIFAVKGPDTPCYLEKEIADSLLALNLISLCKNEKIDKIIIAAHSSGSFVAHNLFQYLFGKAKLDKTETLKDKIIYFNLDGGIGSYECGAPLDSNIAKNLNKIYAVYAYDSNTKKYSSNYETMIKLGKMYNNSQAIIVEAKDSGCDGKWCLHDVLINKKPYNPEKFDLDNDYGNITKDRKVQTDYLDVLH